MNNATKTILGLIVAILVVWGIYTITQKPGEPTATEPIKIGAILPLTGPYATIGEEVKKGIDLAAEDAKKQGLNFVLFYEDDQGMFGVGTVSAANKLIAINKINVAITFAIEEAKPIAPIFTKAKIPLVVGWDSNDDISDSSEYIFSNGFSTEKAGERMAEFAYNILSLRNVALISHIDAWAEIISNAFKNRFTELGGSVVFDEEYNINTTDYRTAIVKMKQSNPDGIYFPLIPINNAQFITQAYQLGLRVPMMTGDGLMRDIVQEVKEAGENIYFTSMLADNNDLALASAGYESFEKIAQAMTINPENIQKGLLNIIGESRIANREQKLYQVKNGVPVEIE
ncbi:MAG: ABC transporter substrate-binding protein [Patescibacteria group bacterium]